MRLLRWLFTIYNTQSVVEQHNIISIPIFIYYTNILRFVITYVFAYIYIRL